MAQQGPGGPPQKGASGDNMKCYCKHPLHLRPAVCGTGRSLDVLSRWACLISTAGLVSACGKLVLSAKPAHPSYTLCPDWHPLAMATGIPAWRVLGLLLLLLLLL